MSAAWSAIEERAFDVRPAFEANQAIHDARGQVQARFGRARSIEVVVDTAETPAELRGRMLRELDGALKGLGVTRTSDGPAFFSVFVGETLYFLTPHAFFEALDAAASAVALLP